MPSPREMHTNALRTVMTSSSDQLLMLPQPTPQFSPSVAAEGFCVNDLLQPARNKPSNNARRLSNNTSSTVSLIVSVNTTWHACCYDRNPTQKTQSTAYDLTDCCHMRCSGCLLRSPYGHHFDHNLCPAPAVLPAAAAVLAAGTHTSLCLFVSV